MKSAVSSYDVLLRSRRWGLFILRALICLHEMGFSDGVDDRLADCIKPYHGHIYPPN